MDKTLLFTVLFVTLSCMFMNTYAQSSTTASMTTTVAPATTAATTASMTTSVAPATTATTASMTTSVAPATTATTASMTTTVVPATTATTASMTTSVAPATTATTASMTTSVAPATTATTASMTTTVVPATTATTASMTTTVAPDTTATTGSMTTTVAPDTTATTGNMTTTTTGGNMTTTTTGGNMTTTTTGGNMTTTTTGGNMTTAAVNMTTTAVNMTTAAVNMTTTAVNMTTAAVNMTTAAVNMTTAAGNMTTAAVNMTTTTTAVTTAPPLSPNTTVEPLQTPVSRAECGTQQLCVAEPSVCDPSATGSCFFLAARQQSGSNFDFSISGESDGYIAATLSPDNTVGNNDTTYVCANNNSVVSFISTVLNNGELVLRELNVNSVRGRVDGRRIQCSFAATLPSATTRTTGFAISLSDGSFNPTSGVLGSPTTRFRSPVVDLTNVSATVNNEIIPTANHGITFHQSLTQALLITVGALGLAML